MSRIGKQLILVPDGVKIEKTNTRLSVIGPKGKLEKEFSPDLEVVFNEKERQLLIERPTNSKRHKALHGLTRSLIYNMVEGVTKGYQKLLIIKGLGYNAKVEGKELVLQIGFCHPVRLKIPDGIEVEAPKQTGDERINYISRVIIKGIDKQAVGQFAADIRGIRPVEPYNEKGIRYADEEVKRKAGKTFVGAE